MAKKPGNFYKLWAPVFKSESRFSKEQPVPELGKEDSSREDVEYFYNFWYNFDSWRTFEYLDEDVPDDNENRDQKRHVERKNNNQRKKRKVEDTVRLRKVVDEALAQDERIKKFRQESSKQKNAKKIEKEAAEKKAKEDAQKAKEEAERLEKERAEAEKAEKAEGKKAKEAAKNAAKKNKRVIRNAVKDGNYFVEGDASAGQVEASLNETDSLINKLDNEEIATMAGKLNGKSGAEVKSVFQETVAGLIAGGKVKEDEMKTLA